MAKEKKNLDLTEAAKRLTERGNKKIGDHHDVERPPFDGFKKGREK